MRVQEKYDPVRGSKLLGKKQGNKGKKTHWKCKKKHWILFSLQHRQKNDLLCKSLSLTSSEKKSGPPEGGGGYQMYPRIVTIDLTADQHIAPKHPAPAWHPDPTPA